jgi:uncharacterized protein YhbP (UPF0306 family)
MEKRIVDFIQGNKIVTICCTDGNNRPYCFQCFYAFEQKNCLLFFKSSSQTFHANLLSKNANIAGSILPEKMEFLALKGIQVTGTVLYNEIPGDINPQLYYHKKFPLALSKPGDVWCIQLEMIKMTDNTHVFGKKLMWNKAELV